VVSKPQIKFKGKASGRSGKRSPAAGGMSHKKGLQRSHCASDGVLKPLHWVSACVAGYELRILHCGVRFAIF